jgi:hypothetical protein
MVAMEVGAVVVAEADMRPEVGAEVPAVTAEATVTAEAADVPAAEAAMTAEAAATHAHSAAVATAMEAAAAEAAGRRIAGADKRRRAESNRRDGGEDHFAKHGRISLGWVWMISTPSVAARREYVHRIRKNSCFA